jgi:hypothetical protein
MSTVTLRKFYYYFIFLRRPIEFFKKSKSHSKREVKFESTTLIIVTMLLSMLDTTLYFIGFFEWMKSNVSFKANKIL